MKKCYCHSNESFTICCEPFLAGAKFPQTPEQLMRSRYTAYVLQDADYLLATTHKTQRRYYSKSEILKWSKNNTWVKLEVLKATENQVTFKAYYLDENIRAKVHHEQSTFKQENSVWYYVDGVFLD